MKYLVLITVSFLISVTPAKSSGICEQLANSSSDPIRILAACLNSNDNFDPINLLAFKCGSDPKYTDGDFCIDEKKLDYLQKTVKGRDPMHEAKFAHCSRASMSGEFCFNGHKITDEGKSANKMMMSFLCSDEKIPKGVTVAFGPCEKGDRIKTDEESCYCQFIRGEEKNGLAYHCTGLVD